MLVLSLPIVTLPITLPCYLFHKWRLGRLQARDPHCGQPAVPVDTPRKRTGPADGRVTTDAYDSAAPPEIEGGESPDVDANPGGDAA